MKQFDIDTAYFIVGMLSLVIPAMVWKMLADRQIRSLNSWCFGGVLVGLGTLWVNTADPVTTSLPLGLIGPAIFFWGLRLKIGALNAILNYQNSKSWWLIGLLLYVITDAMFSWFGIRANRSLFQLISHILLYSYLAWLSWRIHVDLNKRSVLWIFWGYSLVVLMLVALPLGASVHGDVIWKKGWPAMMLVIFGILVTITNHMAFMGLLLESLSIEQSQAIQTATDLSKQSTLSRLFWISERERVLANVTRKLIHEINQSLTSMSATVALMNRALRDNRWSDLNIANLLSRMGENLKMAEGVLRQIQPLAKSHTADVTVHDFERIVRDAMRLLDMFETKLSVTKHGEMPLSVVGNKIELMQVVVNLMRNSAQACLNAGIAADVRVNLQRVRGYAVLLITDNGPGFSIEALSHAGERIFTTKDDGMGLGLWISKDIVSRYGGELRTSNRAQGGAEVTVLLPLSQES